MTKDDPEMAEDNETERKKWERPELIVLVRCRPEESVLTACKGGGGWTHALKTAHECKYGQWCAGECWNLDVS